MCKLPDNINEDTNVFSEEPLGEIEKLFNENLTQEEWNALCIVHRLTEKLKVGIRFEWSHSIDVRTEQYSQIIDEEFFLNNEF